MVCFSNSAKHYTFLLLLISLLIWYKPHDTGNLTEVSTQTKSLSCSYFPYYAKIVLHPGLANKNLQ